MAVVRKFIPHFYPANLTKEGSFGQLHYLGARKQSKIVRRVFRVLMRKQSNNPRFQKATASEKVHNRYGKAQRWLTKATAKLIRRSHVKLLARIKSRRSRYPTTPGFSKVSYSIQTGSFNILGNNIDMSRSSLNASLSTYK